MDWLISINNNIYNFARDFNSILKKRRLFEQVNNESNNISIFCARTINNQYCGAHLILKYKHDLRAQYYLTSTEGSLHKEWCFNGVKEELNNNFYKEIISSELINNFYKENIVQLCVLEKNAAKLEIFDYTNCNIIELQKVLSKNNIKKVTLNSAINYFFEIVKKDISKNGLTSFEDDFKNNHFEVYNDHKNYIDINLKTEKFRNAPIKLTLCDFTKTNYDSFDENGNMIITIDNIDVFELERADTSKDIKLKKVRKNYHNKVLKVIFKNQRIIQNLIKLKQFANSEYENSRLDFKNFYGISFLVDKTRHYEVINNTLFLTFEVLEYEEFVTVKKNLKYYELDEFIDNKLQKN
ncbi:hypothetical protein [Spiroplasma tabanidicola]|uniref:Uncharacterized protein n=1 Tax=Spiroplasma tabanidicola TaxID=324079 RepID=A0A6I6CIL5_9MOLU|nr:hypothetical protein [Spiroplasma tabanidicola]QGS51903.1 hypothetical protein STABA_v1c05400 [Spiroplasma tabanidicola]